VTVLEQKIHESDCQQFGFSSKKCNEPPKETIEPGNQDGSTRDGINLSLFSLFYHVFILYYNNSRGVSIRLETAWKGARSGPIQSLTDGTTTLQTKIILHILKNNKVEKKNYFD
jgi:hypothetical protein